MIYIARYESATKNTCQYRINHLCLLNELWQQNSLTAPGYYITFKNIINVRHDSVTYDTAHISEILTLVPKLVHYLSIHFYTLRVTRFCYFLPMNITFNHTYKTSIELCVHVILLTFHSPTAESTVRLRLTYHFTFRLFKTYIY
jgi:hypothetical protein